MHDTHGAWSCWLGLGMCHLVAVSHHSLTHSHWAHYSFQLAGFCQEKVGAGSQTAWAGSPFVWSCVASLEPAALSILPLKTGMGPMVLVRLLEDTGKVSSSSFSSVQYPQLQMMSGRSEELTPLQGDSFYVGLPHASLCFWRDGKSTGQRIRHKAGFFWLYCQASQRICLGFSFLCLWNVGGEGEQDFKWWSEKLGLSGKFLPGAAKEAGVEAKGWVGFHP